MNWFLGRRGTWGVQGSRRAVRAVLTALVPWVAVAWLGVAHGDTAPSVWQRAKDPEVGRRWALHQTVRELLVAGVLGAGVEPRSFLTRQASLERARDLLEGAHAETSPDLRLRFDLGEVYQELDLYDRAIAVLKPALALGPDHAAAADAWLALAYAHAKRGEQAGERDAYRAYLALETNERRRVTAWLNLAEAEMHLGRLAEAVEGYREAMRLAASLPFSPSLQESSTLALWGLAVALDRSGDGAGSREQAELAIRWDPGEQLIGHSPNVFFVPAYERQWYLALAAMAHASVAKEAREAVGHLRIAEGHWTVYVQSASEKDRWLPLARVRLAHAKRARQDAEGRARVKAHDGAHDGARDGAPRLETGGSP